MKRSHPNYTFLCSKFKSFTSLYMFTRDMPVSNQKIQYVLNDNIPYAVLIYRLDEEIHKL